MGYFLGRTFCCAFDFSRGGYDEWFCGSGSGSYERKFKENKDVVLFI